MTIPVHDPYGVSSDPALPSLRKALDPETAQVELERRLTRLRGERGRLRLRSIRVIRHKPGRRAMVEYDLEVEREGAGVEEVTAIGKVRVRRFGKSGHRLLEGLWRAGFAADSADAISVPEPLGTVSAFRMWLQRKVDGRLATELIERPGGPELGARIAGAADKVHRLGPPPERRHTISDELAVLERRLPEAVAAGAAAPERIDRLLAGCRRLAASLPAADLRPAHRDFYSDQVLADAQGRLWLLDFDLYCAADPGLDVGNLLGHVTEQALRRHRDPTALAAVEEAVEERFAELAGERARAAAQVYATLTLARHVWLSTLFADRRPTTAAVLELCEERLGLGAAR